MEHNLQRKLTTIFCADVQGYSKLMDDDETGTLDTLMHHREAMARVIALHRGRVVNTWGDALIAEFVSPVEAVQAAVEAQNELAQSNAGQDEGRRMLFRIGLNLGDVIVKGDDLYGEGVNIAARLQSLADPGGIVISGTVYDHVRNKLEIGFEFVGEQKVKNIDDPVPSYRVAVKALGGSAGAAKASRVLRRLPKSVRFPLTMIAFFLLINLFSGLDSIWFQWPSLPFFFMLIWRATRGGKSPRSDSGPRGLRS